VGAVRLEMLKIEAFKFLAVKVRF